MIRRLTIMAIVGAAFFTAAAKNAAGSALQTGRSGKATKAPWHATSGQARHRPTAQRRDSAPARSPSKGGGTALPVGSQYHCIFTKGADLSWRSSRYAPSLTDESAAFRIVVEKERLALTLDEQSDFKNEEQSLILLPRLGTPSGTSLYAILPTGTGMLVLHQGSDGRVVVSQWNSYFMPFSDTIYQGASAGTCSRIR